MAAFDGLVAGWRFDEASGNAIDILGSSDLTDNNTCGATTGNLNGCRTLNGTDEFFSHADSAILSTGDIDFTLVLGVYITSKAASFGIAGRWEGDGKFEYLLEYNAGLDALRFAVNNDGTLGGTFTIIQLSTFGSPPLNTWFQVAVGHRATANQIWGAVNAGAEDSLSYSGGLTDTGSNFNIGRNEGGSLYMPGRVDHALWFKADKAADLAALYNGGAWLDYPSGATAYPWHYYQQLRAA